LGRFFPDLKKFKDEYLKLMKKEFDVGMKIFKLYSTLSDEDYDYLVRIGKDYADMAKELHMDSPSTLLRILPAIIKIVRNPRLMKKFLSALAF
jgi:hypothetical protein